VLVGLEQDHPARVDLQLLAGLAVRDRHRRRRSPEAQLRRREAVQRRVRHQDAAALEQPPHLRQPDITIEQLLDGLAFGLALLPCLAVRPFGRSPQPDQHGRERLVRERGLAPG
jgi:hypothetical protein